MSAADDKAPTLAEMVDREIDRCARALCVVPDLDQCAKTAASLDVLLRYRADAERRATARSFSPALGGLPAWCRVGQQIQHADTPGEIIAVEPGIGRIVVRNHKGEYCLAADNLRFVRPIGADGRTDIEAIMGGVPR